MARELSKLIGEGDWLRMESLLKRLAASLQPVFAGSVLSTRSSRLPVSNFRTLGNLEPTPSEKSFRPQFSAQFVPRINQE